MRRVFEDDPRVPEVDHLEEEDPLADPIKYPCPECGEEFDFMDELLDHADTCQEYLPWGEREEPNEL